jgi:RPAP1-like, N-terminal
MSRENRERVEGMTNEEREEERQEIIARFGAGVGDLLKRVQQARTREVAKTDETLIVDRNQSTGNGDRSLDEGTSISSSHTSIITDLFYRLCQSQSRLTITSCHLTEVSCKLLFSLRGACHGTI